jgi:carbon monoxide dehydrogenase subunit G
MTEIERTVEVPRPPESVWAVLADFAGISAWAPTVDHSCLLSGQDAGVGMVRRIQTGRTTVVETVTAWEPGARLAYAITGLPPVIRSVTNTWRLEPTNGGTRVRLTTAVDAGSRPPQQLVAKAIARRLARVSDEMLAGLTTHLASTETP